VLSANACPKCGHDRDSLACTHNRTMAKDGRRGLAERMAHLEAVAAERGACKGDHLPVRRLSAEEWAALEAKEGRNLSAVEPAVDAVVVMSWEAGVQRAGVPRRRPRGVEA